MDTSFRCHDYASSTPTTTITAGGTLDLAWALPANHPGDCSLWISYDADTTAPARWVKLQNFVGCTRQSEQPFTGLQPSCCSSEPAAGASQSGCDSSGPECTYQVRLLYLPNNTIGLTELRTRFSSTIFQRSHPTNCILLHVPQVSLTYRVLLHVPGTTTRLATVVLACRAPLGVVRGARLHRVLRQLRRRGRERRHRRRRRGLLCGGGARRHHRGHGAPARAWHHLPRGRLSLSQRLQRRGGPSVRCRSCSRHVQRHARHAKWWWRCIACAVAAAHWRHRVTLSLAAAVCGHPRHVGSLAGHELLPGL